MGPPTGLAHPAPCPAPCRVASGHYGEGAPPRHLQVCLPARLPSCLPRRLACLLACLLAPACLPNRLPAPGFLVPSNPAFIASHLCLPCCHCPTPEPPLLFPLRRAMVERAEAEQRVVLTRDRTFVAANYSDQARMDPAAAVCSASGRQRKPLCKLGTVSFVYAGPKQQQLHCTVHGHCCGSCCRRTWSGAAPGRGTPGLHHLPSAPLCASTQAYLVQRDTKREQLEEVIQAFKLQVSASLPQGGWCHVGASLVVGAEVWRLAVCAGPCTAML